MPRFVNVRFREKDLLILHAVLVLSEGVPLTYPGGQDLSRMLRRNISPAAIKVLKKSHAKKVGR
jgi:hypothetical protein